MEMHGVVIENEFAEAFRMWACRLIVTAIDEHWLRVAAAESTGYGTSVIACDAEAGVERWLPASETPDGRPGVSLLFFAFNADGLRKAIPKRVGQCLMTCPTTAVFDGRVIGDGDARESLDIGKTLRFFGDGHQRSKVVGGRRLWRIPVMDGEFTCEEAVTAGKAVGGGNLLVCGQTQRATLDATRAAVGAIADHASSGGRVITPFPGGVVRSGSKVGSRYKSMFASTNDEYCPAIRSRVASKLRPGVNCVYEIVINGLTPGAVSVAMRKAIQVACAAPHGRDAGIVAISAGNYGGKLGKFHFKLHELMSLMSDHGKDDDGGTANMAMGKL